MIIILKVVLLLDFLLDQFPLFLLHIFGDLTLHVLRIFYFIRGILELNVAETTAVFVKLQIDIRLVGWLVFLFKVLLKSSYITLTIFHFKM